MDGVVNKFSKFILTLAIGILIGMVIGVVSLSTLISYKIDEYIEEITYLQTTIEEKDVKLNKLEESINKNRFILRNISIELISEEDDEIDKLTLIKHIKDKYNNLLGKEVKTIDIEMVMEVIDKRIMKIGNREYKLRVTKVLISDELKIWVEVN